ncbi:MAG: tRNA (adenosine(37)-N6)-threonylcarbamoyltransferase complex ATPase subunit type 1 TsaE [Clostridia bacterium]|nr:tRNA (adenosine(37)-N6)-threonylcarbamoyltransferase complex ATPase subunit type 1 TsaE [Clostridia bacterium]
MLKKYCSNSYIETENIAEKFSRKLVGGEVIAFVGGLGMGKTCFMRGLARGLDYSGDVTSPTFALINEYRGGRLPIFHFDMYRVTTFDDLYSTGYFDYLDENGVIACEWSENIDFALGDNTIYIIIERTGENSRNIIITDERQEKNEDTFG